MTEDGMAGWHHQLDGHEFEWILRVGDGQVPGSSPSGFREFEAGTELARKDLFIKRD